MMRDYYNLMAIAEKMEEFGGSFVKTLGRAMRLADDDNLRRIEAAFPEYIIRYSEFVKEGKS